VLEAADRLSGAAGSRPTLAAMPRRITVMGAKAAVVTGTVLAARSIAVLASVLAGQVILPGHGLSLSLADGPMRARGSGAARLRRGTERKPWWSPETAATLAAGARAAGAMAIEASVSGSTVPTEHGELVLLVGGDRELYERCESLFAALARQTHYMGPSGTGAMTRLVVNALLGVHMQAIAEAIAWASRADSIATGSSTSSRRIRLWDRRIVRRSRTPARTNTLFSSRCDSCTRTSVSSSTRRKESAPPCTSPQSPHQLCSAEIVKGREEDFSAVIRLMLELSSAPAPQRKESGQA